MIVITFVNIVVTSVVLDKKVVQPLKVTLVTVSVRMILKLRRCDCYYDFCCDFLPGSVLHDFRCAVL